MEKYKVKVAIGKLLPKDIGEVHEIWEDCSNSDVK